MPTHRNPCLVHMSGQGHLAEYFKLLALLQAELHVPGSSALSLRKLLAWMHGHRRATLGPRLFVWWRGPPTLCGGAACVFHPHLQLHFILR